MRRCLADEQQKTHPPRDQAAARLVRFAIRRAKWWTTALQLSSESTARRRQGKAVGIMTGGLMSAQNWNCRGPCLGNSRQIVALLGHDALPKAKFLQFPNRGSSRPSL